MSDIRRLGNPGAAAPASHPPDEVLDEMVRDFCKVGPKPKSEVRRRILEWARRDAPAQPQWIPVEERLPAPGSACLFWTMSNWWESGYFRADDNEPIRWECERTGPQDERIDFNEGQVTHWMIPNPPSAQPEPGKEQNDAK
jgi:hypothetical protein